jgi:hypothetical protein
VERGAEIRSEGDPKPMGGMPPAPVNPDDEPLVAE